MSSDEIKNSDKTDMTLFTDQEMTDLVKGFLIAYANNKIEVNFLNHAQFELDKNGEKLYLQQDVSDEEQWKKELQEMIDIIGGRTPATQDLKRNTVKTLFSNIFNYRMNGWLEGSFYDFVLERKLIEFENKINQHDKTINEYVTHLKEQLGT